MVAKVAINASAGLGGWCCAEFWNQAARISRSSRSTIWVRLRQRAPLALRQRSRRFPHKVKVEGDTIVIGSHKIKVTAIKDPAELPHKALGVDVALECTGIFTARDKAAAHLKAGAKRVLISAPAEGADLTGRLWRQQRQLTKDHLVVSNASCTTNCWRRSPKLQ